MSAAAAAMKEKMAELEAENAKLRAEKQEGRTIRFKVGEKGGLSMYGLGRFPVTLYAEQWERLFEVVPLIKKALDENASKLKRKD